MSDPRDVEEGLNRGDRVRVTWEGGFLVDEEINHEYADYEHFGGLTSVRTSTRRRLSVDNPQRVWVQSLDPDKIRERITGEFLNPDAVALQEKLDQAHTENDALVAKIAAMRAGYEASKTLWKKRHQQQRWLTDPDLTGIASAIEQGEPDPIDWD